MSAKASVQGQTGPARANLRPTDSGATSVYQADQAIPLTLNPPSQSSAPGSLRGRDRGFSDASSVVTGIYEPQAVADLGSAALAYSRNNSKAFKLPQVTVHASPGHVYYK